ncbi:hypothetical protein VTK73DRAFT_7176 [Phialemonium thermophilum]|uniref:Mediator of RNA polymerase II transcription subunit 8 n=1 Tax=Phialemonium thermophilum TaxID=223376 RepID=A0ABR3XTM1_9PEZI
MASLDLTQDELKAIESTRGRLFQLANSLGSLKNDVVKGNPLPTPESLQASAFILQQNLASLQGVITENADLFQRVAVHPSTNFPGRTQEPILLQLLRKKLEPEIETWVDEGRDAAIAAGIDVDVGEKLRSGSGDEYGETGRRSRPTVDEEEEEEEEEGYRPEQDDDADVTVTGDPLSELWADVRDACITRVEEYVRNEDQDLYTAEERAMGTENVRTGLRRNLDEESDEDEDDDEQEDEDDGQRPVTSGRISAAAESSVHIDLTDDTKPTRPALRKMDPEFLLWFASRGDLDLPAHIERESQRNLREAGKTAGRAR